MEEIKKDNGESVVQFEGEPKKEVAGVKSPKMRKIGEAKYVSTKTEIKKV